MSRPWDEVRQGVAIASGQVWQRKTDATTIIVDGYDPEFDDCTYHRRGHSKTQRIYGYSLRRLYEFVGRA